MWYCKSMRYYPQNFFLIHEHVVSFNVCCLADDDHTYLEATPICSIVSFLCIYDYKATTQASRATFPDFRGIRIPSDAGTTVLFCHPKVSSNRAKHSSSSMQSSSSTSVLTL
mmetsp:Transcript_6024/g.13389  ORF Transcript_6024/g.13389 Transcript_6024/m.13389 type:complete len:112 (-) Transcript_6024:78-413(-)